MMLSDEFYEDLDRSLATVGRYDTDYASLWEMALKFPSEGTNRSGRVSMLPPASVDAPHWRSLWVKEEPDGS
jgi:hypothetical protein